MIEVRNELDALFVRSRTEERAALIPYLTGGFPEPAAFVDLAVAVLRAGADALEIGIPFSDPLLDGPVIQRSQHNALEAGVTPADCLRFAAEVRARIDRPLLFMGAYNPIHAYGLAAFCRAASDAGVSGLIVPDLPVEEADELIAVARACKLHVIQLVAPTSTDERIRRICAAASGFIYCISVAGVTGARGDVTTTARPLIERVRATTDLPVAVGFGVAGPEQARAIGTFADGIIVGSALIDAIAQSAPASRESAAATFVADLGRAVRRDAAR
ncbi:MAG TPA: tryptophan synthase subunit alpha [Chloroflexota bacterium]|nr:tryptophan synthase subunit alpha [Chloroflexota bacterium]